nr:hypothetical protein BaRGS_003642 [Batillaria attramentaria]
MVRDYFAKTEGNNQLQVLTEKGMGEAVKEFVDKEEREAISELVKYQLQKTQNHLRTRNATEDAIDKEVFRYKDERKKKKEEDEEVQEALKRAHSMRNESVSGAPGTTAPAMLAV